MWVIKIYILLAGLLLPMASLADTVEVDINGLTCAFCVDNLQRSLKALPDIEQVDVSLKSKKVRIVFSGDVIATHIIKDIVTNSGFTPVKIRVVDDDK
ncbi:MAG: heavy metal-associated domain-containing protein [Pseudomonadales bacterium]